MQKCAAYQNLPCNFEVIPITHFGVISLFSSNFQNFNTIAKYKILEENCSWTLAVGNPHKINKELNYIIQSNYVILNLDKLFPWICWFEITVTLKYSSTSLIRPLPSKATSLIRSDFICTEIVKYYLNAPSREAIPLTWPLFHYRRDGITRGELL